MDPHKVPLTELYRALGSGPHGLSAGGARERLQRDGPNVLRVARQTPLILKFLRQLKSFFALLLCLGGALALLGEHLDPGHGNKYIAYALFGVVLLNAVFTFVQEHQGDRILASFQRMLAPTAVVIRDGRKQTILASELVVGDILVLSEGDGISADARLIEHHRLKVDLSSLTGESEPRLRHLDFTHDNLLESRNMVFSGTLVQSGTGKALVCATGMATQIGRIVRLTKETKEVDSPIKLELRRFVRIISAIAVSLGVLFFLMGALSGRGTMVSLIFGIGIIVANVPEGLLPTVTLSLTMASKRMARRKALVKNLESVETLGSTTVICTDKTGTLTQNKIRVGSVWLGGQEYAAWDPEVQADRSWEAFKDVATSCNNAYQTDTGYGGDPIDAALLAYATTAGVVGSPGERLLEAPFDSASRRMTTLDRQAGGGYRASLKGAPEIVIATCDRILCSGRVESLSEERRTAAISCYQRLARQGQRVLALAWCDTAEPLIPRAGYVLVGIVGMTDPARPEVEEALRRCHSAGIRVIMITGDNELTAESLARQVGMIAGRARTVLGATLETLSEAELAQVLEEPELIFARTSPAQKLAVVKALQARGDVVTVTGDGVNDAPALKHADMGVAMGLSGTEVAREAANLVLLDDNFATIVAAIEEGRTIFFNIRKFIAYILTSNVPEILPFIAYVLLDIPLPLTIVLILAIDLGTDILPALGLGAEEPEVDVMTHPPRPRTERLLTRNVLLMSYGIVGMVQASAGFFAYFVVLWEGGWTLGEELAPSDPLYRTAVTAFFSAIVVCQIADVLICRTRRQSLWSAGLLSNRLVLLGIVCELLMLGLISYAPALNTLFGTAPLAPWQVALSVPFALFILVADEVRRYTVRQGAPFAQRWLIW